MCEALNTLPHSGGLFDQPAGVVFKMEAILAASGQPDKASQNLEDAKERLKKRFS